MREGRRVAIRVVWGAAALLAATARPAEAAPPTSDGGWQILYDSAIALLDKGDPAPACPMLEDAAQYRAGAGVLIALGRCYAAAGRPSLALDRYQQALAAAPQAKSDPAGKAKLAREGIAAMELKVAWIEVSLPLDAPVGARIRREGKPVASGTVIVVDPGSYEIVVEAPEHAPARVKGTVAAGERTTPVLRLGESTQTHEAQRPPPAPDPDPAGSRSWVVPGIAIGAAVAGVATMSVAGGMLIAKKSTIAAECDADRHCSQAGMDAIDVGKRLNTVGTVGAVVGIAGVAGFVTWLVWPKGAIERRSRIVPAVGPGFAGVEIGRAF